MSEEAIKEQIITVCKNVRSAIETQKEKTYSFKTFPAGCCKVTSKIIGRALIENGVSSIKECQTNGIIWKNKHTDKSHHWLETNTLIIDITADQFTFHPFPTILVYSKNERLEIHNTDNCSYFEFELGACTINLFNDYNIIKSQLL
jgi:hypothetical protein